MTCTAQALGYAQWAAAKYKTMLAKSWDQLDARDARIQGLEKQVKEVCRHSGWIYTNGYHKKATCADCGEELP